MRRILLTLAVCLIAGGALAISSTSWTFVEAAVNQKVVESQTEIIFTIEANGAVRQARCSRSGNVELFIACIGVVVDATCTMGGVFPASDQDNQELIMTSLVVPCQPPPS